MGALSDKDRVTINVTQLERWIRTSVCRIDTLLHRCRTTMVSKDLNWSVWSTKNDSISSLPPNSLLRSSARRERYKRLRKNVRFQCFVLFGDIGYAITTPVPFDVHPL
ncbi:hypothetical protein Pla52n_43370 [Stieleria varia]|uniref:Uncharacterized protein n=1 Tax=Stieleria varia TaxID=2528005 RepID=A0A5C6AN96_9BACT|nr:hypothetical protein Pla52n_43370 [Stieleria varia]